MFHVLVSCGCGKCDSVFPIVRRGDELKVAGLDHLPADLTWGEVQNAVDHLADWQSRGGKIKKVEIVNVPQCLNNV